MEERQEGQVLPLAALVMLVAALAVAGLGQLAIETAARARATTAADAAALAGVIGGERDAVRVAAANNATVTSFERLAGGDVRVRIDRDGRAASARARARAASSSEGGRGATTRDLAPAMRAAIARAEQVLGHPVPITSGYRSPAEQRALWDRRPSSPYPVARPEASLHERGLAIDVPASFAATLAATSPLSGLCQPYPNADPVHFELCGEGFTRRNPG